MNNFKEMKPENLNESVFRIMGNEWMLITGEKEGRVNTMTAAWGGFGVMWNKNVAYTVIRPQRYTKEFVDSADTFSLCFFDKQYKKELGYLGSVSGRDEDKILKSGLSVIYIDSTPCFQEARLVVICKKLYAQYFDPELFLAEGLDGENYPNKDYHMLYISQVQNLYCRDEHITV